MLGLHLLLHLRQTSTGQRLLGECRGGSVSTIVNNQNSERE